MKKAILRENVRKLKVNPHQAKNIQSQSPPHKKLLRKIEMTQKDLSQQYDHSLQDNLLAYEPKEEAVDFRVEIERRYQRSVPNKIYTFPRNKDPNTRNGVDDGSSSTDSSLESLKHVTVYDLRSQNKKKKAIYAEQGHKINPVRLQTEGGNSNYSRNQQMRRKMSDDNWEEEERSPIPIEIRIRDKNSSTYKKLIHFLEKNLGHNITAQANAHPNVGYYAQTVNQKQGMDSNHSPDKGHDSQTITLTHVTRETEPRPPEKPEKQNYYQNEFRNSKYISGQGSKKTLSYDRVPHKLDMSATLTSLETSFNQIGPGSTKGNTTIDMARMNESLKRIYNNSLIKSATPQYVNGRNLMNLKDNLFKTNAGDLSSDKGKIPSTTLYQKAQNDVLANKFRITARPVKQLSNTNINSMVIPKREGTPKDSRNKNFANFYGSPDVGDRLSTLPAQLNTTTGKNSFKTINIVSPNKHPGEKHIYMSYDFNHSQVLKKQPFKLDLSKRSAGHSRDVLSSGRNRGNGTADRISETFHENYNRTSYDTQHFNSILNTSSQRNSSKKVIAFAPGGSTIKNLSFTKMGIVPKS